MRSHFRAYATYIHEGNSGQSPRTKHAYTTFCTTQHPLNHNKTIFLAGCRGYQSNIYSSVSNWEPFLPNWIAQSSSSILFAGSIVTRWLAPAGRQRYVAMFCRGCPCRILGIQAGAADATLNTLATIIDSIRSQTVSNPSRRDTRVRNVPRLCRML